MPAIAVHSTPIDDPEWRNTGFEEEEAIGRGEGYSEVGSIVQLCVAAGRPDDALSFLARHTSLAEVDAALGERRMIANKRRMIAARKGRPS